MGSSIKGRAFEFKLPRAAGRVPEATCTSPGSCTSLRLADDLEWVALALARDPLHERALAIWTTHEAAGMRWVTSIPVVLETFTFLSRAVDVQLALTWKGSLAGLPRLQVLECGTQDLERAWVWFARRDLHRLSAVDASNFVLMAHPPRVRLRHALRHGGLCVSRLIAPIETVDRVLVGAAGGAELAPAGGAGGAGSGRLTAAHSSRRIARSTDLRAAVRRRAAASALLLRWSQRPFAVLLRPGV